MDINNWDREKIAEYLPHQGEMMLIDKILSFDEQHILALANNHLNANHPLRNDGRLGVVIGIEYCAQAAAIHSRLSAQIKQQYTPTKPGKLVSVREVYCKVKHLDDFTQLTIAAKQEHIEPKALLYSFAISNEVKQLISGRLMIHLAH